MLGVLVNLPSATTTLADLGQWSSPIFDELSPFAFMIGGLFLGAGLILLIIAGISAFVSHISGKSHG